MADDLNVVLLKEAYATVKGRAWDGHVYSENHGEFKKDYFIVLDGKRVPISERLKISFCIIGQGFIAKSQI